MIDSPSHLNHYNKAINLKFANFKTHVERIGKEITAKQNYE